MSLSKKIMQFLAIFSLDWRFLHSKPSSFFAPETDNPFIFNESLSSLYLVSFLLLRPFPEGGEATCNHLPEGYYGLVHKTPR
jgi:hypothetical protein